MLSQPDLNPAASVSARAQCSVQAMPGGGLAFFNCGDQSGASQPHKHIQVTSALQQRGTQDTPELLLHA